MNLVTRGWGTEGGAVRKWGPSEIWGAKWRGCLGPQGTPREVITWTPRLIDLCGIEVKGVCWTGWLRMEYEDEGTLKWGLEAMLKT